MRLLPLLILTTSLAALTLLSSCGYGAAMTRVDDRLLMSLPVEGLAPIRVARTELTEAEGDVADAQAAERRARQSLQFAHSEMRVASASVAQERVELERARRRDDGTDEGRAREGYDEALRTASIARLAVSLAKRELEVAALRATLARETRRLSDARLQYEKGLALEGVDLAAGDVVSLEQFEAQVLHQEEEVRSADRRLSAARVDMQRAREAYDAAIGGALVAARGDL
ncbi:MAG: hypothetical protein AAGB93_18910 [Planctomycetota bacterium]